MSMVYLYDVDDKSVEHLADCGDVATEEDRHRPVGVGGHVVEDPSGKGNISLDLALKKEQPTCTLDQSYPAAWSAPQPIGRCSASLWRG